MENTPPICPNCRTLMENIGEGFGLLGIEDNSYLEDVKMTVDGRTFQQPERRGSMSIDYGRSPVYRCPHCPDQ